MQAASRTLLILALASLACCSVLAGRLSPEDGSQQPQTGPSTAAGPLGWPHGLRLPGVPTPSAAAAAAAAAAAGGQQHAPAVSTSTPIGSGDGPGDSKKKKKKDKNGTSDYDDQDPDVRSHWALLVAGSSGWYNYRHQADVYHAYQVLRAGGYRADHIVVMAADDLAHDPENPMPGKVFNRPGGPDVYEGVTIDYRGPDVSADTFLAVLLGDAGKVAGKGSGRVVDSGPHDRVFVFYSDHGAAGVLGMPNGPFLYADELIKALKKKHQRAGFKEAVLYIEACESGSMFEGLLGNDLNIYVTTAANAIESSWATYCPSFGPSLGTGSSTVGSNDGGSTGRRYGAAAGSSDGSAAEAGSSGGSSWGMALLRGMAWLRQQLRRALGAPEAAARPAATSSTGSGSGSSGGVGGVAPTPTFSTCLGDLYSVSWLEDAEVSDLTGETLLQQYKKVKVRTSQNFTYEQGSHVMQYGDLDIDRELAGDYEGMLHNGSAPTPTWPSHEWVEHAAAAAAAAGATEAAGARPQQQQQQQGSGGVAGRYVPLLLQQYTSPGTVLARLAATTTPPEHHQHQHQHQHQHHHPGLSASVPQRDADLVPLAAAAAHAPCPRRRAAAAAALARETASRQGLEAAARGAVAALLTNPGTGYVMMTNLGWAPGAVLQQGLQPRRRISHHNDGAQQQQQAAGNARGLQADVRGEFVEALLTGPLPGREGRPLVDDWDCLRGMVQAWEGQCGALDQYGMKLSRLFANLCNAGVGPRHLGASLAAGRPCRRSRVVALP